ncbi:hypothetical protein [uncultured Methylobacterium sp.]|uniref:hypothetical protein n=1 Tax=uncultured Methylobacterium sp. TaxID=157278 RepID=UPI0026312DA8|nr:hypothetical protein [uncultured Methylobacterium sp.]
MQERLQDLLAGRRNAAKALTLATFLGRFWSAPARLGRSFPVDRRQLADRTDLGLSEEEIRGATLALEKVGFLVREAVVGSAYRATAEGQRRKPILRRFGPAFFASFVLANEPRRRRDRQRQVPSPPHKEVPVGRLMGDRPGSGLEQALWRWRRAVETKGQACA